MDLFSQLTNPLHNLLPKDGTVNYYGSIFTAIESEQYLHSLLNSIEWKNDEAIIFGKRIITKRKVAWYGDHAFEYAYSNTTKTALPWTDDLRLLKKITEEKTGESYNSCLLNFNH